MGFRIGSGIPNSKSEWMPINTMGSPATVYVGQIVKSDTTLLNGVVPLNPASGAGDNVNMQRIFGVVTGTNNYPMTELFNKYGQYIIGADTNISQFAIMKMGVEGMHPKGDPQPMVQVVPVTGETVLIGDIYNGTFGVPPTVLTVTTGSSNGGGFTANACDFPPGNAANMSTTYCRTGANAGIYRVNSDTSATVCTFKTPFPNPISVGDTFVRVPYKQGETLFANFSSDILAFYWNCANLNTTDYFTINVYNFDLRFQGKETVTFSFVSTLSYPVSIEKEETVTFSFVSNPSHSVGIEKEETDNA